MNRYRQRVLRAGSAAELMRLAADEGITLPAELAQELFDRYHPRVGHLTDEELENVCGGGCGGLAWLDPPRFHTGDHVMENGQTLCGTQRGDYRGAQYVMTTCSSARWVVQSVSLNSSGTDYLCTVQCPQCGMSTCLTEGQLRLAQ